MKPLFYSASALAYALLAVPVHGADVLVGPRIRAMLAAYQDAGSAPTPTPPADSTTPPANTAQAPASKADEAAENAGANPNAEPPSASITAGYSLEMTGDGPSQTRYETWVSGETPVTIGKATPARAGVRMGLLPVTGQTTTDPTLTTLANYGAIELGGWIGRVVGASTFNGVTVVKTAIIFEAGFRTIQGEPDPAKRLLPYWCSGARLSVGQSSITVCAGQDDLVGDHGGMQIDTWGNLAIPSTDGIAHIGWDAAINASTLHALPVGTTPPGEPTPVPLRQHSVVRVTAYAELIPAFNAIFNKGKP